MFKRISAAPETVRLALMLGVACLFRLSGIWADLYHADEPIVVHHALAYGMGDLNPKFFAIPPFVSYLCFGAYGAVYVIGKMIGWFPTREAFEWLFIRDPLFFYVIGRVIAGVVPGVLTVWMVYRTLRRNWGLPEALWGGWALTVNFLHVRDSHVIYADIWMALFGWMAASAALDYRRHPGSRHSLVAGGWVGAAAAAKYNAALSIAAGVVVWWLSGRSWRHAVIFVSAAAAVFILFNPYALLDMSTFVSQVARQATAESMVGPWHPLRYSLAGSCGWLALAVALGGLISTVKNPSLQRWVIWVYPAVFYAKLAVFSQPHERYVMPIIPFLAAAFGIGAAALVRTLRSPLDQRPWTHWGVVLLLAAALLPGTAKSIYTNVLFLRADTRDLAQSWIESNVSPGAKIAFTDTRLRPRLRRHPGQWADRGDRSLTEAQSRKDELLKQDGYGRPAYYLYFVMGQSAPAFSTVWPVLPPDPEALTANGVRYLVVEYDSSAKMADFKEQIGSLGRRVARFSPYRDIEQRYPSEAWGVTYAAYGSREIYSRRRFGPVLEVYEL